MVFNHEVLVYEVYLVIYFAEGRQNEGDRARQVSDMGYPLLSKGRDSIQSKRSASCIDRLSC